MTGEASRTTFLSIRSPATLLSFTLSGEIGPGNTMCVASAKLVVMGPHRQRFSPYLSTEQASRSARRLIVESGLYYSRTYQPLKATRTQPSWLERCRSIFVRLKKGNSQV